MGGFDKLVMVYTVLTDSNVFHLICTNVHLWIKCVNQVCVNQ